MLLPAFLRALAYPALLFAIVGAGYTVVAVSEGATSPEAIAFLAVYSLGVTAICWIRRHRHSSKEI